MNLYFWVMERIDGIFLLLGSNQGDRESHLKKALYFLAAEAGHITIKSHLYETEAWGKQAQDSFLNQVIKLQSNDSPKDLLQKIHSIENKMGRIRKEKWEERIIDIDILYYNNVVLNDQLKIPHPEIPNRRFTLVPMVEIAPRLIHPVLKKTQQKLLEECKDMLDVKEIGSNSGT